MKILPAEWYPQSGVQLTWPHQGTDWCNMLEEVEACFVRIATEISNREKLLIVSPCPEEVKEKLAGKTSLKNIEFFTCDSNDTWARDHGAITMLDENNPILMDFVFNGWGLKFPSDQDNQITCKAIQAGILKGAYKNCLDFVLEGGALESDGEGTLLTTSECLLSPNRNASMNREEIETYLKKTFHLKQVLWLDHGYLAGDDTDSHIDTLARFCSPTSIVYVKCNDPADEHYEALEKMEKQLKEFRTSQGKPYQLFPLPLPEAVFEEGERLPATYANFLIINGAVLYPTYNQPENDAKAATVLSEAFPGYQIVGIDCRALIKQHGSLHCVTMQYPEGVL
ncbi:MAG: agmatine deiminase family protein [Bacteroides sp.]|nr:agmatine deiminase family protein [Bacteroides sp.]